MRPFRLISMALLVLAASFPLGMGAQDTYREAYDRGYSDGLLAGSTDQDGRKPFDFANRPEYQQAKNGLDAQVHDEEVYSVAYRRGFEDGYEEGYGLGGVQQGQVPEGQFQPDEARQELAGQKIVPKGTEIRIRLLETLSTQRNSAGDAFSAETVDDLRIDDVVVLPAGTRLAGEIGHLKRAGRVRGRSEMNLRMTQIELRDRSLLPIMATVVGIEERQEKTVKDETGTVEAPGEKADDVKKVGISSGLGALIGILSGGGRGAAIGAGAGAVAGAAGVLITRGSDLVLQVGTELTVSLDRDLSVATGLLRNPAP